MNQPSKPIPYYYHNKLHGYLTQIFKNDNYGKIINNFTYTNLIGGENKNNGIVFHTNPYFIVRINEDKLSDFEELKEKISTHTELFYGLHIVDVSVTVRKVNNQTMFKTVKQSPILVAKGYNHTNYLNEQYIKETEEYLLNSIKNKAEVAKFKLDKNLKIKIVKQHNHKNINYKGGINKSRVFEFEINGNDETKEFIMINGMGRSCGCGFGFIN